MDINLLFKIAAIGILVAVLHQVLVRAGREDQAMMTTLAGLVIVLTMVIKEISGLFDTVRTIFNLWDKGAGETCPPCLTCPPVSFGKDENGSY